MNKNYDRCESTEEANMDMDIGLGKEERKMIRAALQGQRRFIRIKGSANSAGFSNGTPIEIVEGDEAPELLGDPYLKTTFRNGPNFTKNLYTPSTLYVRVGREWLRRGAK